MRMRWCPLLGRRRGLERIQVRGGLKVQGMQGCPGAEVSVNVNVRLLEWVLQGCREVKVDARVNMEKQVPSACQEAGVSVSATREK